MSASKRARIDDDNGSSSDDSSLFTPAAEQTYTCRVCLNKAAIYVCPRCLTRSCSLECTRKHKEVEQCSGQKDVVAFAKKKDLGEEHLRQDITLLQNAGVVLEAAARHDNHIANNMHNSRIAADNFLTKSAKDVITKQYGVVFRQSPPGSARRARNTSAFKKKKLKWRVEWKIYPEAAQSSSPVTCVEAADKGHMGACTLRQIVKHAVQFVSRSACEEDYEVLMFDESVPSDQRGFILFDKLQTLNENLRSVLIYDFPTLHLVHRSLLIDPLHSKPYRIDVAALPQWAQPVAQIRKEHVHSFLSKPVYSRSFDTDMMDGNLSPLSSEDDNAPEEDVKLITEVMMPSASAGVVPLYEEEDLDEF